MDKSEDAILSALATMGRVLLFTPIVIAFLTWLVRDPHTIQESVLAGGGTVMICGLVMLGYVGVKRFRRGVAGKE